MLAASCSCSGEELFTRQEGRYWWCAGCRELQSQLLFMLMNVSFGSVNYTSCTRSSMNLQTSGWERQCAHTDTNSNICSKHSFVTTLSARCKSCTGDTQKTKKMGIPGLFRICYYSLQLPNRASGKAKNKAGLEGWLEQGLEWAKGETPWMCMMVLTMPTHPKFTQCKSSTPCTKLAKHNFCWYWLLFSIFSLPLSISASCRQVRIKPHWTSSSTEYFVTKSQTQIICGWRSQPSLQSLQQFTFPKTSRTFSGTHLNLPNGWISILVCCVSPSKHRKQQPLWGTGSSSKS